MAALPIWIFAKQLPVLGNGDVVLTFAVICSGKVFTDRWFIGRELFGGFELRDRLSKLLLITQDRAQAAVRLPELRVNSDSVAKVLDCVSSGPLVARDHSHFVNKLGVVGVSG